MIDPVKSGDQPEAIQELVAGLTAEKKHQTRTQSRPLGPHCLSRNLSLMVPLVADPLTRPQDFHFFRKVLISAGFAADISMT